MNPHNTFPMIVVVSIIGEPIKGSPLAFFGGRYTVPASVSMIGELRSSPKLRDSVR